MLPFLWENVVHHIQHLLHFDFNSKFFSEFAHNGVLTSFPEFDSAVFGGDVGVVQGPVKTDFGFHLLEVTERTE